MDRRRNSPVWLMFVVLAAVILAGAWLYMGWQSGQRVLPQGLSVAGLSMGGMTREQALKLLADAYASPIMVYYQDQELLLVPEMVELVLDVNATLAQLDETLLAQSGFDGFVQYVLHQAFQREVETKEIYPILSYSRQRVDTFLARTAQQFDRPPLAPVPLPDAGTFRPPQPGTTLDMDASRPLLIAALLSPTQYDVHLVVLTEPIPPASMEFLRDALAARLAGFTGVAGIYIKDIETGRELCYQCKVAFAGLSTLKIGLLPALYRDLNAAPPLAITTLISETLTESDNASANRLLAEIGAGDAFTGALRVTDFFRSLGLENTFMAIPYDSREGRPPPGIVTPANSRTDVSTNPDPYIQTTPLDMGLLLEALYQCTQGGGNIRLVYPREITPQECEQSLDWLERNQINTLLGAGMPEGVRLAHKHGWAGDTHADVALIYSPGATFVLAVFLYQPDWLVWEESAPTFADIGQLTYRFFNPGTQN